jgi:hypothetical protein
VERFRIEPGGPFSLANANRFFGGWPTLPADPSAIVTSQAVQYAYSVPEQPHRATILSMAEVWRPYRAWAMVLLHLWLRREGGPSYQRPGRKNA